MGIHIRIVILIIALSGTLSAWRSELYPQGWMPPGSQFDFYTDKIIQDFSYAGYHRGEKEIPSSGGNVYNAADPPFNADNTGGSDATGAIQSAIDAAGDAGGGVVYLPAGTYRVSPPSGASAALQIGKSNIILRGAGAGKTFILNTETNMRSKHIIRVSGSGSWSSVPSGSPVEALASDVMGPSRALPVENAGAFAKGEWVLVHAPVTEAWIADHQEAGWAGYAGSFSGIIYLRQIDSIASGANTIHIDIPTRYAIKVRDGARVYRAPAMLEEAGVEHLSIGNLQNGKNGWAEEEYSTAGTGAYEVHASYAITFDKVRNGWIRSVETFQPAGNGSTAHILSNGILLTQSRGITVDSCHFQRPQYGGGGGNGYMYRLAAQENLFRHTQATFTRHGFVLSQMYASGNVFFQCIDKDAGNQTGLTGSGSTAGRGSDHHMHFSHSNLFDGCTADNSNLQAAYRPYGSAPLHNLTAAHSVYWNIRGLGAWPASIHTQQARYGYAIGTWGEVTAVNTSPVGNSASKTDPADHVEGVGEGESLVPPSLYLDQLEKRTAGAVGANRSGLQLSAAFGRVTLSGTSLQFSAPEGPCEISYFSLEGRLLGPMLKTELTGSGRHTVKTSRVPGNALLLVRLKTPAYTGVFKILAE